VWTVIIVCVRSVSERLMTDGKVVYCGEISFSVRVMTGEWKYEIL